MNKTVFDARIQEAVRLHQSGRLADAAVLYRSLLDQRPDHGPLLNLMGVAALQQGDTGQAVALLRRAVQLLPDVADIQDNLGSALRSAGQPATAVEAHRRALALKPDQPSFHFNLGNALADLGTHRQAVEEYRRAAQLRPGHASTHFNLANSLAVLGDMGAAVAAFRAVIALNAGHAQAWNNLGGALATQGELAAAVEAYERALTLRPGHAETLSNLGNILVRLGQLDKAVDCHRQAVAATPQRAEAHIFLGVALQALDRPLEAVRAYRSGLALAPGHAGGMANLGAALEVLGLMEEAEAVLSRALTLDPSHAEAWGNLALCRLHRQESSRAQVELDRALELDPDLANARISRGLLLLGRGDFANGMADYEWRFAAGEARPHRRFAIQAWDGEELPGQHLLIWREQGLGDELMFAGFYRQAASRVGRLTIECDRRLLGLFTRSFPSAAIRAEPALPPPGGPAERPVADRHTPAGSLPRLLAADKLGAYDGRPYLVPDPRRLLAMRNWLAGLGAGLRVGFCWRSRLMTHRRLSAYATTAWWAPLVGMTGIIPINLQYGAQPEELTNLEQQAAAPLHQCPDLDLMDDLEGVAALIASLDLVITAPTAIGELAGALGVPVWRIGGPVDWSRLGTGVRPWFGSQQQLSVPTGQVRDAVRLAGERLQRMRESHV
jgi:tetratricopeptide (TPR) repeat protein